MRTQLLLNVRKFASKPPRTVAACIIGDEILSGRIADTNAHFLGRYIFIIIIIFLFSFFFFFFFLKKLRNVSIEV